MGAIAAAVAGSCPPAVAGTVTAHRPRMVTGGHRIAAHSDNPRSTPHQAAYIPGSLGRLRVHTMTPMAVTVSLSTRVAPEVRDRLAAAAAERGMPLATYTRTLLSGVVPEDASPAGDVANEVACIFAHLPPDAGLRREICMCLARTAEQGGTAGIAAGKALLDEVRVTRLLFEPEDFLDDEDEDDNA
jgi:hypothetical protein